MVSAGQSADAMKKGGDIWIEGERELFINMQRSLDGTMAAAMKGLRSAALNIIADAKENLKDNHSVATGQLRASGKVQRVEGDSQALDAGFFAEGKNEGYAFFVEYGRRSGKMPPVEYIKEWLRKKRSAHNLKAALAITGKSKEDFLLSTAWAIAKSIAKKGTKPHPFFDPAVKKNEQAISEAIAQAVKQEIK